MTALPVIALAKAGHDFTVSLTFSDGRTGVVNFRPVIARGGLFRALEHQARFAAMRIGERGRSLVWIDDEGEEIDFCADALWLQCGGRTPPRRPAGGTSGAGSIGSKLSKPASLGKARVPVERRPSSVGQKKGRGRA